MAVPGASEKPVLRDDEWASGPSREGRDPGPGAAVPGQRQPEASRREPSRAAVGVLADRIAAAPVPRGGAAPSTAPPARGPAPALALWPTPAPPTRPDPESGDPAPVGEPRAVHVEMQPPPPSVARSLRLSAGEPAAMVTIRLDDPVEGRPVALTVAVFRPDMFRIVVDAGERPLADGDEGSFSGAWTHAVEYWKR